MLATLDYFDWQNNDDDFSNWWTAMKDNDAIITSGWSEVMRHIILEAMENILKAILGMHTLQYLIVTLQALSHGTMVIGQNQPHLILTRQLSSKWSTPQQSREEIRKCRKVY